jgi:hypothetical protein
VIALSALLVIALLGWFTYDFLADRLRASGCGTPTVLNVTVSPDIAPVVTTTARELSNEDNCYDVRVSGRDSAATAESLVVSDGTEPPDVWIPESTIWLQRAQARGAWDVPVSGTSIASSPVVLALTEDAATQLGWPAKQPSWIQILSSPLSLAMPDPGREPVGVSLLYGVREMLKGVPEPGTAITAELRSLSQNSVSSVDDLFTRLPGRSTSTSPVDGFPLSENAVLRNNARQTGDQLVAVYAEPAVPSLDYPYVVLPDTRGDRRAAAEKFLTALMTQATADALSDAGFRTPDGEMLRQRGTSDLTSGAKVTPAELPAAGDIDDLLNTWAGVNLSGRVQVLLDVSGSMAEEVPGAGATRMALTLQAAELGIGLMKPSTKLGVWMFSTKLDGDKPYREVVPMLPISEQARTGGLDRLRAVQALPDGATALYDSLLAAYQSARQNYEPGRINVVILLTDGRDDNRSTISREALLPELARLQDPRRPILIVAIGIGPDPDLGELQSLAGATGGQAFVATDPTKIGNIFYAALSKVLCQPPNCQTQPGG